MAKKIVIIGSGPGGYVAAFRAAQLGADVTVIENDNVGGTCLNWGCIPSKIMKSAADMLENFRRAPDFGIKVDGSIGLDMQRLADKKQQVIQIQTQGILALFKQNKIQYMRGKGAISRPGESVVTGPDGATTKVPWDKMILAPGSKPLNIPSFPFDAKKIISSNDAVFLQEIPESILILGGGVIGCEFASIFASLGSKVTLVEAMSRLLPLPSVDGDCSKILQREMKKQKIKFMLNATVTDVDINAEKIQVTVGTSSFGADDKGKHKKPLALKVEKMLVCIGRRPNTAGIGLQEMGAKTDENGWICADNRMQTNVSDVYAIGDVLGPSKIMLAHVASTEGIIAAENAMGQHRKMIYNRVPAAIFTTPEVANVGLTESQAYDQGHTVRSDSILFRTLGKAQVIGKIAGQAKIVSSKDTGEILGVHIIGPHATELIAEATLALKMNATVKDLAETIHAHPTLAEVMLEASYRALDRPLHG